jgi:hypothetical protein
MNGLVLATAAWTILAASMTDARATLTARLERATSGLVYQSETDAPVTPYRLDGFEGAELTEASLLAHLGRDAGTPVATVAVDEFFADLVADQEWYGDEERDMARRYRRLVRMLERALKDLKVYRVGEREVEIYVLGRTRTGEFAGVTTRAVET